jgi:hypothetical protein
MLGGTIMVKKAILLTIILLGALGPVTYGKAVSGIITMDFDLSHHEKGKEVQLWIPYPVSDDKQDISGIEISGDYMESAVYTDKIYKTPMLYARWESNASNRKLRFAFRATRDEVERPDFPDQEAAWDPRDYAIYLSATRLGPIDGEVKALADEITRGKTSVLAKAKAIYDWTVVNTYRNPDTKGCGLGDVYRLLRNPGGKCVDISSIYVAISRAADVPAREIFGIRMGKESTQDISTWQHCWAEFYLPGHDWVSVDPADVRKGMLVDDIKLQDPRTVAYHQYFWGGVDPYRIKLGEGRDLTLNPAQHGDPVNYLMYPFAQVGKDTVDWLDPSSFKYTIHYSRLTNTGNRVVKQSEE